MQYACGDYRTLLEEHGIICSMSGRGNCYNNAAMESFFQNAEDGEGFNAKRFCN